MRLHKHTTQQFLFCKLPLCLSVAQSFVNTLTICWCCACIRACGYLHNMSFRLASLTRYAEEQVFQSTNTLISRGRCNCKRGRSVFSDCSNVCFVQSYSDVLHALLLKIFLNEIWHALYLYLILSAFVNDCLNKMLWHVGNMKHNQCNVCFQVVNKAGLNVIYFLFD